MNDENKKIVINYTNHRGETRPRTIIPKEVWFGVSQWHDGEQWFLKALDVDKQQERDFALRSIGSIGSRLENVLQDQPTAEAVIIGLKEVRLYTDGGSRGNPGPSAIGYVLIDEQEKVLAQKSKYLGITTNNQAEYQALKEGLEFCKQLNVGKVFVHMDSLLVVNQMKGVYKVKNRDLWPVYDSIKNLIKQFDEVTFTHVPRELNKIADAMVNDCLDTEAQ